MTPLCLLFKTLERLSFVHKMGFETLMANMVSVTVFCAAIEFDVDGTLTIGEIQASLLKDIGDLMVLT